MSLSKVFGLQDAGSLEVASPLQTIHSFSSVMKFQDSPSPDLKPNSLIVIIWPQVLYHLSWAVGVP